MTNHSQSPSHIMIKCYCCHLSHRTIWLDAAATTAQAYYIWDFGFQSVVNLWWCLVSRNINCRSFESRPATGKASLVGMVPFKTAGWKMKTSDDWRGKSPASPLQYKCHPALVRYSQIMIAETAARSVGDSHPHCWQSYARSKKGTVFFDSQCILYSIKRYRNSAHADVTDTRCTRAGVTVYRITALPIAITKAE